MPFFSFPGATAYTAGSARIAIYEIGKGFWERNTSKKIYVYLATEDDSVRSNRVIIQAN